MPIFRGIEMSVVASTEAKKLREYPHPDGSSVRLVSVEHICDGDMLSAKPSDSSILSDGDPTRQKKINPRTSVYIASVPGEQFWVRYNVIRSPAPATHLYFKMYMNGRLITSWGLHLDDERNDQPKRAISGTVVRALYEPGERSYDKVSGTDWKAVGIETRYFYFMPGLENISVAEDGGLIEVQVFRSKGRKPRAPKMSEFRNQERYGITSPSGGLVENPQDATYYDWLLIDPKDAPYATFCFHYRSMRHLLQLSLIPHSDSRPWLPKSESLISNYQGTPIATRTTPDKESPSTPRFAFGIESLDSTIFNDDYSRNADPTSEKTTPVKYFLKSPPNLTPAVTSNHTIPQQPIKTLRDASTPGIFQRPLPEPPTTESRHSSRSSLRSNCPSLTPSITRYVDNGNFGDDEISIGMAHTVISSAPSMVELPARKCQTRDDSFSDYENSPPSTAASQSPARPSPKTYISTTGSVLECHIAQFASPIERSSTQRIQTGIPVSAAETTLFGESPMSQMGTFSISESEWMRRTPSPAQLLPTSRLWSPRLGKKGAVISSDDKHWRGRYSDIEPCSPNEVINKDASDDFTVEKPAHAAEVGGTTVNTYQDGATQHLSKHGTRSRNTWESCRELPSGEYEAGDKPLGNWI